MSIEAKHSYRFKYLRSEQWKQVRLEALVREGGRCEICGEESVSNDAHHIWYPVSIYDTTQQHLAILCRPCHDFVHAVFPESKTRDEQVGVNQWTSLRNAIIVWRKKKICLFQTGLNYQPPSDLRRAYEDLRSKYQSLMGNKVLSQSDGNQELSPEQEYQILKMILGKWWEEKNHLTDQKDGDSGQIVAL